MTATEAPGTIGLDSVARAADEVGGIELDGELLLFTSRTGFATPLNPTAALMWQCFDGSDSLGAIAADIADVFALPVSEAESQTVSLARLLNGRELLSIDGVEPPYAPASTRLPPTRPDLLPEPPAP